LSRFGDGRLVGDVAVVTGSTSGLGAEIARRFAFEGAAVLVTGRNDQRGRAVVDTIAAAGGQAAFAPGDLSDPSVCGRLVQDAEAAFGPVSVLVNNAVASAVGDGPVTELDADVWHAVWQIDVVAMAALCRTAIPSMLRAGHGSIVNVSSRVASLGTPRLAAYTAAKGAMNALTRSITADYARQGIRCNTVQPGYILHETRDAHLTGERRARIEGMQLTRVPTAADVASAVLFLASSEAEVISGVTLPVDGGSTAVRALSFG